MEVKSGRLGRPADVALVGSADHDEGIASFREKRSPVYTGG
jgi:hypothetical protein